MLRKSGLPPAPNYPRSSSKDKRMPAVRSALLHKGRLHKGPFSKGQLRKG
jgi:hypothetical protein